MGDPWKSETCLEDEKVQPDRFQHAAATQGW